MYCDAAVEAAAAAAAAVAAAVETEFAVTGVMVAAATELPAEVLEGEASPLTWAAAAASTFVTVALVLLVQSRELLLLGLFGAVLLELLVI